MHRVGYLTLEIGPNCNLSHAHEWCPASVLDRRQQPMEVKHITSAIRSALDMGFTGHVAFHFYNEPLLYADRIEQVINAVPEARYLLWSNGVLRNTHADLVSRFGQVIITSYDGDGNFPFAPDRRLENYGDHQREAIACRRPWVELPVDYTGDVHLCCQDWLNTVEFGNITTEPFPTVAARWLEMAELITSGTACPQVCHSCLGAQ